MPKAPPTFRPHGLTQQQREQQYDQDRGSSRDRGYDARWAEASWVYRQQHPLCEYCALEGRTTPCSLVDHLYPHRRNMVVFWIVEWWVASCTACHSGMKQVTERRGRDAIDILAARLRRPLWRDVMGLRTTHP